MIMKRPGCSGLLSKRQQCAQIYIVGPTSARFSHCKKVLAVCAYHPRMHVIIVLFHNPVS